MTNTTSLIQTASERFSDRDLLRRFIHDGDESAFAAIVERYAALVMSVCRRIVQQSADVDDAFQATFFALSRRPQSIYECRSLSGWLYSVAWRTSTRLARLRNRTMMQSLPEHTPAAVPDPLDLIARSSDLAALDEEMNQLPQKYRDVLVMSYFAQQTNQEIADQLNESKGAVDGRVRDARRILRVRLARRGVNVGVLTAATAFTQSVAAAVPPALIQSTSRLGSLDPASSGAETIPGVDLARLRLLTSTGTTLMSSKTGFVVIAGFLFLSGVFGMARLAATPEGRVDGDQTSDAGVLESGTGGDADPAPSESAAGRGFSIVTEPAAATEAIIGRQAVTKSVTSERRKTGAASEFARSSARAAERQLNELLSQERIPALLYPGDNSLEDVLKTLAESLSESRGERLLILLDEKDPDIGEDAAFLESTIVSDVNLPADSMTVASALDLILAKVKDQELTWIAKDEVLLITTMTYAESQDRLILRSYDITGLRNLKFPSEIAIPAGGGMGGGGGFFSLSDDDPEQTSEKPVPGSSMLPEAPGTVRGPGENQVKMPVTWEMGVIIVIREMTSPPCRWIENGDDIGTMSVAGNRLLVRQTRMGHEKVVEVLDELELAAEEMGDDAVAGPASAGR